MQDRPASTGFHVTLAENLPSILEYGLRPGIGERSLMLNEPEPLLYLFETLEDVEAGLSGWMADVFDEDDPIVIIEVDLRGIDARKLPGKFEITVNETLASDRIVAVLDERLDPIEWPSPVSKRLAP